MLQDLIVPLVTVGLAELGDKSQLSIFLLASKTRKHFQLLGGVMLAFLLADGIAIAAGGWVSKAIPLSTIKIISAAVFITFGILVLLNHKKEAAEKSHAKSALIGGFVLILASEMGDKTQIAAGLFAAKYNALLVLAGVMAALLLLSTAAIYFGKIVSKRIKGETVAKISGVLFILIGLSFLILK